MTRKKTYTPLSVFINSRLVGQLERKSSGAIHFQYAKQWLDWEHAMPVSLSLPLREDRYAGAPVIAVFDNLLPDNAAIRTRAAQQVNADGDDMYSLLAAIGKDCIGAMQFLPAGKQPASPGDIAVRALSESDIAETIRNLNALPLGMNTEEDFRISLTGAQQKTALLYWDSCWQLPLHSTATTHILKPQIGIREGVDLSRSVENEYLCMTIAKACGLRTADVEIRDFEDQRVLVITRFDRQITADRRILRLPQEDICQALSIPPEKKYERDGGPGIRAIAGLLKASDEPENDLVYLFKAQILFWLLGATDGHAKNFSLFLLPGGRFRMTPLYDVMSLQPSIDNGNLRHAQYKMAMSLGDNRHYRVNEILPRHYQQTAKHCTLAADTLENIFSEISDKLPAALEKSQNQLSSDFPPALADSIISGAKKRLARIRRP